MVRMIPETIHMLNLDRVLYDIHMFLRMFPSSTWRERGKDLPLRTMKTVLHTMVRVKGSKVGGMFVVSVKTKINKNNNPAT